ncbi:MAG: hypothetical protein GXP54_06350 [Deltaproteobacteria bacterium]|nr:hypothetical protein [Deltaproteobacteria bacterium]
MVRWYPVALFALMLVACIRLPSDRKGSEPRVKEEVKLPPRPDLAVKPVAEKYRDGALTVAGFLKHAKSLNGKEVTLRGYVYSIKSCSKEEKVCSTVPHLVIVDDKSRSRVHVLAVSDPPADVLEGYPVGTRQTLKGKVAMWSPNGRLIDLDGILVMPPKPKPAEDEVAKKK